jgi:hypothetical protein
MEKIVERESNKEINKEHEHKKQVGFCDDQHQDQNQGTSSKQQLQMLPPKPYYTNTNTNTDGNTPPKPLNPNTNTDVNTSLKHMSYQCPGLSGPGCRMCIEPWSFDKLLSIPVPIVIPIFQRRYCWTKVQLKGWWRDSCGNKIAKNSGPHTTGKTTFKMFGKGESQHLCCIDGQQRSTSMSLLLAAIRDELYMLIRSISDDVDRDVVTQINATIFMIQEKLFLNPNACTAWADTFAETAGADVADDWERMHVAGGHLESLFNGGARLRPSYVDRKAFYELLTIGTVTYAYWKQHDHNHDLNPDPQMLSMEAQESPQGLAKRIFDASACKLGGERNAPVKSRFLDLQKVTFNALNHMSLMYCEVLTPMNISQVFLWMQEKSLFGMGALLKNDNPGIPFTAGDLARNLLLCPFVMNEMEQSKQDRIYEDKWIFPLAVPAEKSYIGGLDGLVTTFVQSLDANSGSGSLQKQLADMFAQMPFALQQTLGRSMARNSPLDIYARLHGHIENVELTQRAETKCGDDKEEPHKAALQSVLQQLVDFLRNC